VVAAAPAQPLAEAGEPAAPPRPPGAQPKPPVEPARDSAPPKADGKPPAGADTAPNAAKVDTAPPAAAPAQRTVYELIGIIDTSRDAIRGKWGVVDNVLRCNDQHFAPRVQIRYEPPEEYEFIIQFSQPKLRHSVAAIMPNRHGGSFVWQVGLNNGNDCQLMSKPPQQYKGKGLLQPNRRHTTIVQVRRGSVRCFLDGFELVHRRTDFSDLTIDGWNKMPEPRLLGVACDDPTVFYQVRIAEIGGKGKRW
jgi:hypothetical protein